MKKIIKNELNFIPVEERGGIIISRDFYFSAAAAGIVTALLFFNIIQIFYKGKLKTKLNLEISRSQLTELEINKINTELSQFEKKLISRNLLASIESKRIMWGEHLKEISLLLPKNVWISSMKLEKSNNAIDIVLKGESLSFNDMSQFYGRLTRSLNYSNLLINSTVIDRSHNVNTTQFIFGNKEEIAAK